MYINKFSSKLLDNAVNEFAKLPGIGRKTALRLVLYLLRQDVEQVNMFGEAIIKLRNEVKHCKQCNNISDNDICEICSNPSRDHSLICVVESIKDVIAIENTNQYNGIYHVLGGIISPMDGIGPNDLKIDLLEQNVAKGDVKELIFALSTTMEGDTTNFFLYKKLSKYNVVMSTIARGVSIGDELEYTDELTLGRSIVNRTPFESSI
jgi:recombination protein RecR